jgi:hypothetical protein
VLLILIPMSRSNMTKKLVRFLVHSCAFVFLFAVIAVPTRAQTNKGTIKGTVSDQQGGVIQHATVTITNVATNDSREVATRDDGTFEAPLLDPGTYKVTVKASGFSDTTHQNVVVQTSSTQVVDVTLQAGQASAEVTVTAAPTLVQSETSDVGTVVTGAQVTDLPIPQRNFTLLATLSPGVNRPVVGVLGGSGSFESGSPAGNSTEGTRFRESGGSVLVVNGARPTSNNFMLDGVDNNEGQFAQIGIYPPPDAIAEFKIQTSVAPAEGGRAGGGIITVRHMSFIRAASGALWEETSGGRRLFLIATRTTMEAPSAVRFSFRVLAKAVSPFGTDATVPSGSSIWKGSAMRRRLSAAVSFHL